MGFDLTAKRRDLGDDGYFRIQIFWMRLYRRAMVAAGVSEDLVYTKFLSNDGYFVTLRQSQTIADKLDSWLRGRNLTVDLCELHPRAVELNRALAGLLPMFEGRRKPRAHRLCDAKPMPLRLDRRLRQIIRGFAGFCRRSGGFWIT
jgi:hypothetical protein